MEELNFHRPEFDGRNQCLSELPWSFPNGKHPRCALEAGHTLDHAGGRFTWTDDEERKVKPMNRWLGYLVRLLGLMVCLAIYAILMAYFSPAVPVPLWFVIISVGALTGVFVCCTGVILSDVKKKVKKEYRG